MTIQGLCGGNVTQASDVSSKYVACTTASHSLDSSLSVSARTIYSYKVTTMLQSEEVSFYCVTTIIIHRFQVVFERQQPRYCVMCSERVAVRKPCCIIKFISHPYPFYHPLFIRRILKSILVLLNESSVVSKYV